MNRILHSHTLAGKLFLWLAFLCLCAGLLAVPAAVNAEDNSVSYQYDPENWMKYIPGHTDLAEINLPGTHDSGTAFVNTLPQSSMCQVYSIGDQLKYGIRVFDLRVRYDELDYAKYIIEYAISGKEVWPFETMVLSHGGCDCYESYRLKKLTTKSVFSTCKKFVQAHPSEGIILQLKTETAFYDTKAYEEDIKEGLNNVWKYVGNDPVFIRKSDVATLNDLRGKILIMIDEPVENVTSYHYGNMNDPEANDAPKKKVKYVYAALDSSGWQDTALRTVHATLWREADYEQEGEKGRKTEGRPEFQQICTNATDVKDFKTTVIPKFGPIGYAEEMREALKKYNWLVGKRYGIIRMDFPSRSVIQKIVESNNNYVRYQADFIWNDTQDHQNETPAVELVDNGKVLHILAEPGRKPLENGENGFRITYETVLQRSKTGEWFGGAVFQTADGCEYALTLGPVEETREWFTDKAGKPYLGFVRTQKIYVGELEKKTYDLPVYYLSEIDDKPYRPKMTPSDFLGIMDNLTISWKTNDGIKHTGNVTCGAYSKILTLDSISEVSENQWMLHISVPKFDRYGIEIAYHFDNLSLKKHMTPFVQCDCGQSDGIGLKLPQNQMIEKIVAYQVLADGGYNQFNEAEKVKNAMLNGGIHHIADTDDGDVVIDEYITDPARLRFGAHGVLYISVQEYDEHYHWLNHRFEPPQLDEFDLTVEIRPNDWDLWNYRLMTDLTVTVSWDDDSDYAKIRPSMLDITFYGRNQKNVVLTDQPVQVQMLDEKDVAPEDRNRWRITTKMPVLYLPDGLVNNNVLNPEEKLTQITVPGYAVKNITKKVTQGQDGKPIYDFDILLSVVAKDACIDVSGAFIFDDADLRIADHSKYLDGLTMPVLQNNKEMQDPAIYMELNKEIGTYSFQPKKKFPAYQYGEYMRFPYRYQVVAPPSLEDYELVLRNGFDLYYRRLVSISGTVDWMEGMKPKGDDVDITVKLFCNGEDTDQSIKLGKNNQYLFDWLPISGKTGAVNQYSIKVETSYYGATSLYSTVERDPDNGCFTQDALLSAKWNIPEVDIPIQLELKNADPATEPEEFTFELVCTSDEDIASRTIRLNRENGFAGDFHLDDLAAYNHIYTFEVKQQVSVPKDYWQYDTDPQTGALEISLRTGYAPQVYIQLPGGKDKLTFVNLYTGTGSVASIKLNKSIVNRLAGIKEVPKKTFTFSLYDLSDGEPKLTDYASITGEGSVQFGRLRFNKEGTYRYQVSENIPDGKLVEWTYDRTIVPVEITVENVGGVMQAYVSTVPEFTNVYENECFDINVRVEWEGVNKKWPIPKSVNVQLLADGSDAGDADAAKNTGWICKFPNMPGYSFPKLLRAAKAPTSPAKLIEYTLTADEVPGYRQNITGSAKTGYVITYSLKYPPDTGDNAQLALWLLLACAAVFGTVSLLRRKRS